MKNGYLSLENSREIGRNFVPLGLVGFARAVEKDGAAHWRNGGALLGFPANFLLPLGLLADHDVPTLRHVLHQLQKDVGRLNQIPEVA